MIISKSRAIWSAAAAAIMASLVSWADGQPDTTFGTNGVVKIGFPNSSLGSLGGTALINGQIETAGLENSNGIPNSATPPPKLFIAQLSLAGVVASMQTFPQTAINGPNGLVIAPNGDVIVTGATVGSNGLLNATAVRFSSAGAVLATYTRTAASTTDQSILLGKMILDSQGRLVGSGVYGSLAGTLHVAAVRLTTSASLLTPDATFGTNGFAIIATEPAGYTTAGGTRVVQDPSSGAYYVGGVACSGAGCIGSQTSVASAQIVARLMQANGSLDMNYGNAGFGIAFTTNTSKGNPEGMAVDTAGNVVIGGNTLAQGAMNGTSYVARLTSSGVPDTTFGTNGVVNSYDTGTGGGETVDLVTDSSNRVYALSYGSSLYRLTNTGAVDSTFQSTGSNISSVNGNASSWQAVQFSDSTQSSVYLVGGVSNTGGCAPPACTPATTAVIEKVLVAASLGQVAVPNVVGQTQAAATTAITGAGLTLGTVTQQSSSTVASGSVISENPAAGTNVASGSVVNLVVSTGAPAQVAVPNVVGQTQTAATTAITGAGLMLGTVTQQSSSTVASGSVISESPAAATMVASGSAVNLVVSTGPAPVAVPNVVGQTQAAATTAITAVGLALGTVTMQSSSTVASGSVISESPAAGTMVASASAVNLTVSNGAPMGGGGGGGGGGGSISALDLSALLLLVLARASQLFRRRTSGAFRVSLSNRKSFALTGLVAVVALAMTKPADAYVFTFIDIPFVNPSTPCVGAFGLNDQSQVVVDDCSAVQQVALVWTHTDRAFASRRAVTQTSGTRRYRH